MTIKDKMKTYNFWISLVSAILLVARVIAEKFNFVIDSTLVMDIITGMCGIFVVLGIISAPQKTVTKIVNNDKDGSTTTDLTSGLVSNEEIEIKETNEETDVDSKSELNETEQDEANMVKDENLNQENIDEKIEDFNAQQEMGDVQLEEGTQNNLSEPVVEPVVETETTINFDELNNLSREELIDIVLRMKNN